MNPVFLSVEDVLALHAKQLARFGGADGVRDIAVLESAVAQPQVRFGGAFLHPDLIAMGAAYLFHLVQGHAFVDGNKRVGLLSTLVFLDINGVQLDGDSEQLYALTMKVAQGRLDKEAIGQELRLLTDSA